MKRKVSMIALAMFLCFGSGYLMAAQSHMHAALSHLNSAKNQLQQATHNKGGHRVNALNLVNQAIAEVNKGIAAGAD